MNPLCKVHPIPLALPWSPLGCRKHCRSRSGTYKKDEADQYTNALMKLSCHCGPAPSLRSFFQLSLSMLVPNQHGAPPTFFMHFTSV
jgi:hypothetical protein